ncbi:MAG: M23 family metallopeptidase [Evtepia gabavorous]
MGTGTKAMPELPDGCLFLWPVQGPITSEFGYRFIFGENNFHRGLDIAAAAGTAINAAADGTVIFSGEKGTYGNLVILSHGNGFLTYYAHCSKLLVQVGDSVTQGQPIAAVGSTGRSTGPHCHFEVRYQNNPIDPLFYLPGENNAPVRTEPPEEERFPLRKSPRFPGDPGTAHGTGGTQCPSGALPTGRPRQLHRGPRRPAGRAGSRRRCRRPGFPFPIPII